MKADPHLLNLKKAIKDFLTDNNIIKADIFISKFFPKTKIIDFNNIEIKAIMEQKVFNMNFIILIKKIAN